MNKIINDLDISDTHEWIDLGNGRQRLIRKGRNREDNGKSAHVIGDTMNAMVHPLTGKLMDSKSEFRKITRAHGCVEVGNEKMKDTRSLDLPPLKEDIARAIRELEV